jgi:hypothetical protein
MFPHIWFMRSRRCLPPKFLDVALQALASVAISAGFKILMQNLFTVLTNPGSSPADYFRIATALQLLIRWFLGDFKYAAEVYGENGAWRPAPKSSRLARNDFLRRFPLDVGWFVVQGALLALVCNCTQCSFFWILVAGLLAADALLLVYDRNAWPKAAQWLQAGYELRFPGGQTTVWLRFIDPYPPRVWIFVNVGTLAAVSSSLIVMHTFNWSEPQTTLICSALLGANAFVDFWITRFGYAIKLPRDGRSSAH